MTKTETLADAIALRDKIAGDIADLRARLTDRREDLAAAEQLAGSAIDRHLRGDDDGIERIREDIAKIARGQDRATAALHEADARVVALRNAAASEFLVAQRKRMDALRKRFRDVASQLVAAFDDYRAFEAEFVARSLPAPGSHIRDTIVLNGVRCADSEFEQHIREFAKG